MADETGTSTTTEPSFKIVASGTHGSLAAGGVTMDAPPAQAGPAEPATPAASETTPSTTTPPAAPSTAEPATATTAQPGGALTQQAAATAAETTPPATTEPPKPITWEEALKANDFPEDFINLAKVFKQEGNIARYATAMNTDFSKMPAEDVHKLNLQRQYPEATKEELDILYQTDVVDKYKLDENTYIPDSAEAKAGRLKLEMDAKKLRTQFQTENDQLKLPTRDVEAETRQQQEAVLQQRKERQEAFMKNEYTQNFIRDKKIVFTGLSIKDESGKVVQTIPDFTMKVEKPEEIQAILTDPTVAAKYLADDKGNALPNVNIPMAVFTHNPVGFMQSLINYGKMLGKEEYVTEKHNPPAASGTAATPPKETLQEAIANRGKHGTHGG